MRRLLVLLSLAAFIRPALGEEVVRQFGWSELRGKGALAHGAILPADSHTPFEQLRVVSSSRQPVSVEVATIQSPALTSTRYALIGKVRYENVEGQGHLEMWSFFPDGNVLLSRTLAQSGPMQYVTGDSDWRLFSLPYNADGIGQIPDRLVMDVVFSAGGTVVLGQLQLVQYEDGWWRRLVAGGNWRLFAGVVAGIALLYGALGLLVYRGSARRFVTAALTVLLIVGLAGFAIGVVSLVASTARVQPLQALLVAALLSLPAAGTLAWVRRHYDALELRRMDAMDATSHAG